MAGGAVGDVPWVRGIVEAVGVGDAVIEGIVALVEVNVPAHDEVDSVFEEDGLEDVFALPADGTAGVRVADIPRSVTGYDGNISRWQKEGAAGPYIMVWSLGTYRRQPTVFWCG